MRQHPSTDLFWEKLHSLADFELAGTDFTSGVGYRVTVRRADIDFAAFSGVAAETLQQAVVDAIPLFIGATQYQIEPTFGPQFLQAVKNSARIAAVTVTVQSRLRIVTFIGLDMSPLADLLREHIPATLHWEPESLVEGSREWGRKVGHAAKDLAGVREATIGVEGLATLERSGESEAYEAVRKDAVWPAPNLDALRERGVVPEVAFGIVSCWRMLRRRPARNPAARLAFVRELASLRTALERCRTLDRFAEAVRGFVDALRPDPAAVVGPRLPRFAQRLCSRYRDSYSRSDTVLCDLLRVANGEEGAKWDLARAALTHEPAARQPVGLPMPTRQPIRIDQLQRSGLGLPEAPAVEGVSSVLGLTGLELGNYVSRREGQVLVRLLAESLTDLRHLLGDWVAPLCRRGNLSVALGSRGNGKACAHYEPALRVINLTKTHGDGSLAHEFAHFLDHMLAGHSPKGESRFLARVIRQQPLDRPVAQAMAHAMQAVMSVPRRKRVVGEVDPNRWYRKSWIAARGYSPERSAQESFDLVVDHEPDIFRRGRNCEANSVTLVHSLAKLAKSPVEVEVAFEERSQFLTEAVRLGVYWKRPEELFARAFESFIEDELSQRGQCSQYLVFGTQRDYTDCRGLPYPVGDERRRMVEAMRGLVTACAAAEELIGLA